MEYDDLPQYWINHVSFQLRKQLEAAFAARGHRSSSEEWALLLMLSRHESLSPSALARLTLRDATTVSRLIDRLERKALIARRRARRDRRIVDVEMTETGRAHFARLAEIAQTIIRDSLSGLTDQEIELSVKVLRKISENLADPERKKDV